MKARENDGVLFVLPELADREVVHELKARNGKNWVVVEHAAVALHLASQRPFGVVVAGSDPETGVQVLCSIARLQPEMAGVWIHEDLEAHVRVRLEEVAVASIRGVHDREALMEALVHAMAVHHSRLHRTGRGRSLLLIEQDARDAEVVTGLLQVKGWEVCRAHRLSDGLAKMERRRFDVVLTALALPDATGLDAVAAVCMAAPTTPVVVHTHRQDTSLELQALRLGAQDYLLKNTVRSEHLSRSLRLAAGRKNAELRLTGLAHTDSLTGLANRRSFLERLRMQLRRAGPSGFGAVMLVDLDHFKVINDTHGHAVGDEVLRVVGARLRATVRPQDGVGRLGGDEFGLLLMDPIHRQEVERIARRVRSCVAQPIDTCGPSIAMSVSIGVTWITPEVGTAVEVLRRADSAMYAVKADGRDGVAVWGEHGVSAAELAGPPLLKALDYHELCFHYQAQRAVDGGRLVAVEALIRWNHPEHGLLLPDVVLPAIEATNVTLEFGRRGLDWALQDLVHLRSCGQPNLRLAFNLSPLQVLDPCLVDVVEMLLEEHGLPGNALEIEITHRALLRETPRIVRAFHDLRRIGVRVAIDDFGTGWSALAHLGGIRVDVLKIDGPVVAHVEETAGGLVVQSLIELGHRLGLEVVAEGIQTEGQLQKLARYGLNSAQGTLLGEAMPVGDWRDYLRRIDSAEAG